MKKTLFSFLAIASIMSMAIVSCKKENTNSGSDSSAEVSVQSDDQSRVSEETDAVTNDAVSSIESSPAMAGGRVSDVLGLICDATITLDSVSATKKVTITYNGSNCQGNRTRTGAVVVLLPTAKAWKDPGAAVTITYTNVKITRNSDAKSITLNGTHTVTNVSGGLLWNLPNLQSITHTITSSDMSITFDDGSKRTWQVARQRVFTYNNGIVITQTGTKTDGTTTGIETWGTTRFGGAFTNQITQPLVVRQDCSFRLVSGSYKHTSPLATATIIFGLDKNGVATGCPGTGTYYYKATWTVLGKDYTFIFPY